jgi:hypothetical protein
MSTDAPSSSSSSSFCRFLFLIPGFGTALDAGAAATVALSELCKTLDDDDDDDDENG